MHNINNFSIGGEEKEKIWNNMSGLLFKRNKLYGKKWEKGLINKIV